MHPIEHLRYVARARGLDPIDLTREAAIALASLRADHANLVIACRRIVERHPEVGQLWWLCARMLTADDPVRVAWESVDLVEPDAAAERLAAELADELAVVVSPGTPVIGEALDRRDDVRVFGQRRVGDADAVLIEPHVACVHTVVVATGVANLVRAATAANVPVWLVAAPGTRLPPGYVDAIAERCTADGDYERIDSTLFHRVISADAAWDDVGAGLRADCGLAPELLRQPA